MSRRQANSLASEIESQFVRAPPEIRLDFLRKSNEAFETESNEFVQTLMTFQKELGQITSTFENNKSKSQDTDERAGENSSDGKGLTKSLVAKYPATKVVVNPEISEKVRVAEASAISKYLEDIEFQKKMTDVNTTLKSYARPATSTSLNGSAFRRPPLSAKSANRPATANYTNDGESSDDEEIAEELREMKVREGGCKVVQMALFITLSCVACGHGASCPITALQPSLRGIAISRPVFASTSETFSTNLIDDCTTRGDRVTVAEVSFRLLGVRT
ncbi:unnamed protein product [Mesocestoides corti]|uniref:Uncharacterized protein n=2 Tax=Mesocestoides corti TaxID=53468 RepID=A0A0R3U6Y2_MESCO|nr:unnamed protein product [Mesocestoides corti]